MLTAIGFLALGATGVLAGSPLVGRTAGALAARAGLPGAPVRAVAVGIAGSLAATVIAAGRDLMPLGGAIPFGAIMFVVAAAFGAALLLGRRPSEVRDPVALAAPAGGLLLVALMGADRAFVRSEGILLALVFLPYLAWVALGTRDPVVSPHPEPVPAEHDPAPTQPVPWWPETGPGPAAREPEPTASSPAPAVWPLSGLAGAALVIGGAFAVVEGALRVAREAPLVPGFAGAAVAGTLTSLPFVLAVVSPRRPAAVRDPRAPAGFVVVGLATFVPGIAAVVRPFELDGPATIALLGAAGLYAVAASWMLIRTRGGRVLGLVVLAAYAGVLWYAGSL